MAAAALVGPLIAGCSSAPHVRDASGKPDGARIFSVYCEGCHGPDGRRGDGPMKLVASIDRPDAELRAAIENGKGGMPAWRGRLKPDEIDAVLAYIKRFP